jgi:putative ABC transport system ATP-binding protein
MQLLKKLNVEQNKTILLITHDANVASFAQKIIHIKDGLFVNEEIL